MEEGSKYTGEDKKIKFRPNVLSSKKGGKWWILIITVLSFFLSASMLLISSHILQSASIPVALLVVFCIIVFGIIFDIIGIAVAAGDETPFHAMASRKLYGAKQSIRLIRNANKVSAFCNDVVGDISSVISGTASAIIIYKIVKTTEGAELSPVGLLISGLVAAATVGGKALGKTIAIENSNYIVYKVSVILKFFIGRISFGKNFRKQKPLRKRDET